MSTVGEQLREEILEKETVEKVDYKMVTFSLAGKDYGIDIMTVKEISKASKFTYVPNSIPYVKGVYNLRGEIISVIDLRKMFNLPVSKSEGEKMENMIILRLEGYLIGVIVDTIDKVVGIASESIQPPHPLFGGINIQYIKGIVDHANKLYVILDAERILGSESKEEAEAESADGFEAREEVPETEEYSDVNLNFISETLITFKSFHITDVNRKWAEQRYTAWKKSNADDIQLKSEQDADNFLTGFLSPDSSVFWNKEHMDALGAHLNNFENNMIIVWNPGCGRGYETYSFTTLLRQKYPDAQLKIWGNDSDLLSISTAPNLVFQQTELGDHFSSYISESSNGFQFNPEIKDVILFEYHDILNQNPFPPLDIILARDIISFHKPANQMKIEKEFWEKLKPEGLLIVGKNETGLDSDMFAPVDEKSGIFRKIK